jgi:hypothetical protein
MTDEKKASEGIRLAVAVYPDRADDEQDAIIEWLQTLPRKPDGGFPREVIRRHMLRALYQYVMHGTPKYPLNMGGAMEKPVLKPMVTAPSHPVATTHMEVVTPKVETTVQEFPVQEPVQKPSSPGGLRVPSGLSKKIASSMSGGDGN